MNDFEKKILESLHSLELKFTKELGELRGELKAMDDTNAANNAALRDLVQQNIAIDTTRLNKHAEEIDEHHKEIATLKEWKNQFEKSVSNRIAISQSVSGILAVVIAFLLSKFF